MANNGRSEINCSYNELKSMMLELGLTQVFDVTKLRHAFLQQIRQHHTDKGGSGEKAKNLTKAFRILKTCLEEKVELPNLFSFNDNHPSSSYSRSASRSAYQATRSAYSHFESEEYEFIKRKNFNRKNNNYKKENENETTNNKNYYPEYCYSNISSHNEYSFGIDLEKRVFINGYKYTNDDLSDFSDLYENEAMLNHRIIRGGLILFKDFSSRSAASEYSDLEFPNDFNKFEFLTNPIYEPILRKLEDQRDDVYYFSEKLKAFVNLDWAMTEKCQSQFKISSVHLNKIDNDNDNCLYEFTLSSNNFDHVELFSTGIHVKVCSFYDNNIYCLALVDSVNWDKHKIVLFFTDEHRLRTLLMNSNRVNMDVNSSAFVYRSILRSIDFVQQLRMKNIIFPRLSYRETIDEFKERRDREIQDLEFLDDDGYNDYQKNAIFSIFSSSHCSYPFILFGPPGTGKTVTLIESIRHLTLISKDNRVLVCTPSKMAADNFAEALLAKNFIDPKYVFRMHSLSTSALDRNKKLDSISYLSKESNFRFFGIPDRLNLRVFRIIISTLSTSSYLISAGGFRGYFTHIFVDEAGQATEPDTWIPIGGLADNHTSVILSGDPKQLGPVVNNFLNEFGFSISMLKRLIYSEVYKTCDDCFVMFDNLSKAQFGKKNSSRSMVTLKQTYRSHFQIMRPCSYLFYNDMLSANKEDDNLYKLCEWEGLPSKGFPIIFFSSENSEEVSDSNKSFSNNFEAIKVVEYVEKIIKETDTNECDIGVISPYKNQVLKLRQMLVNRPRVTIDSVERFQGSEREVIIMSTVRTEKLGFLKCDLRLNTSISRAKSLLIIIGNDILLSNHITWDKFIYYCRYHGGYLNNQGLKSGKLALYD